MAHASALFGFHRYYETVRLATIVHHDFERRTILALAAANEDFTGFGGAALLARVFGIF
jgi:hypothetical protein